MEREKGREGEREERRGEERGEERQEGAGGQRPLLPLPRPPSPCLPSPVVQSCHWSGNHPVPCVTCGGGVQRMPFFPQNSPLKCPLGGQLHVCLTDAFFLPFPFLEGRECVVTAEGNVPMPVTEIQSLFSLPSWSRAGCVCALFSQREGCPGLAVRTSQMEESLVPARKRRRTAAAM